MSDPGVPVAQGLNSDEENTSDGDLIIVQGEENYESPDDEQLIKYMLAVEEIDNALEKRDFKSFIEAKFDEIQKVNGAKLESICYGLQII